MGGLESEMWCTCIMVHVVPCLVVWWVNPEWAHGSELRGGLGGQIHRVDEVDDLETSNGMLGGKWKISKVHSSPLLPTRQAVMFT